MGGRNESEQVAAFTGIRSEFGLAGTVGSEGEKTNSQASVYGELFVTGGLSAGHGVWGGFWSGDVSELSCATEIGIDTPYGSISVLFDLSKMNFGFTVDSPSAGAEVFAKVEPLHGKREQPVINKSF